jgi:hypothetical protein
VTDDSHPLPASAFLPPFLPSAQILLIKTDAEVLAATLDGILMEFIHIIKLLIHRSWIKMSLLRASFTLWNNAKKVKNV